MAIYGQVALEAAWILAIMANASKIRISIGFQAGR